MNSETFRLALPSPCTENWESMSPTNEGRHCSSCAREVVDFTNFTRAQLHNYFILEQKFNCGIFRNDQLSSLQNQTVEHFKHPSLAKTVMLAASMTVIGINANGQTEISSPLNPNQFKIGEVVLVQDTVLIQGRVLQGDKPIQGLTVRIESHSSVVAKTDSEGYFTLHFYKDEFENEMVIQVIDSATNTYLVKQAILAPYEFVNIELPLMSTVDLKIYEITEDQIRLNEDVQHTAGVPLMYEFVNPAPTFNIALPDSIISAKKREKKKP